MRTLILFSVLMLGTFSQASLLNIQQLNKKIQASQGTWIATENHLTEMTPKEARRYMGLSLQGASEAQFLSLDEQNINAGLPSKFDWRNKEGQNWVSPILDQANCGSCVAFATVGVLETQYRISSLFPNFNLQLSPQHLFSCGGGSCENGWRPEKAAKFIQRYGIPDEACMPYKSGSSGQDIACNATCKDSSKRALTISEVVSPTRGFKNITAVKKALQKGPVVTSMKVYRDFPAYSGGVYKHTSGEVLGGHAISIVGYDDDKNAFIIRNSWGESWGEKGFAYISYDDTSGVGDETWLYSIPPLAGGVSIVSPDNYSYFTKTASIKAFSSFPSTDTLSVGIYNSENNVVANLPCHSSNCDQDIDISELPDGRYEVQVYAMNNRGEKIGESTRHFFYVANQASQMTISFQGAHATNLNRPLKERVEIEINTSTNSVPMSSVDFYRKGPNGKMEYRSALVVPSKLIMGWNTDMVPNGAYEIWYVGHIKTNNLDLTVESSHQTVTIKN